VQLSRTPGFSDRNKWIFRDASNAVTGSATNPPAEIRSAQPGGFAIQAGDPEIQKKE
jgi:hypothetical protein